MSRLSRSEEFVWESLALAISFSFEREREQTGRRFAALLGNRQCKRMERKREKTRPLTRAHVINAIVFNTRAGRSTVDPHERLWAFISVDTRLSMVHTLHLIRFALHGTAAIAIFLSLFLRQTLARGWILSRKFSASPINLIVRSIAFRRP